MARTTSAASDATRLPTDGWPWQCLTCGSALYHDAENCRNCAARPPASAGGRSPATQSFSDWMRREPYPTFVLKVTTISGAELALTALWLHLVSFGPAELIAAGFLPI